jgi:two-component system, OmpR family, alkaline phosphatase synthesis response regulator PhoP
MTEKKTILVIDDDPDIVETVQMILSSKGYNIISASSGRQGIELLRTTRPDLILCDMMMEAIDSGMQTAQQIRQEHVDIPVFLLSSIAEMTAATTQIRDLGFNGILQKPVDPARLAGVVQSMLG